MAIIYPSIENIKRLKVPPTNGELFLINYLVNNFDDSVEIYYQPFLNGDRPDFILLKKDIGAIVIEVKDWDISKYYIDNRNKWHLSANKVSIKSPFQQVYGYKDNLFDLHINGMLEARIRNKVFYGRIKPFVYFHNVSTKELNNFYNSAILSLETNIKQTKNYKILNKLQNTLKKFKRDILYVSIANDQLSKISFPKQVPDLFKDEIYNEFKRVLNPPIHILEQGKEIKYTPEQLKCIDSLPNHRSKIKGVAGSGKTMVLAKRAVNAFKRHGEPVLILTFNITLIGLIRDRISEVRETFPRNVFHIINYHQYMSGLFSELDFDEITLDDYDDTKIFDKKVDKLYRYKTILIDEIQDYKIEWIQIVEKYFASHDAEIVLFGDEKQDIYRRDNKSTIPIQLKGYGHWKNLSKSVRYLNSGGRIKDLTSKFQSAFFRGKYELDINQTSYRSLDLDIFENVIYDTNDSNKYEVIVNTIMARIKEFNLVPNDIVILSSSITTLREIEYIFRVKNGIRAITTFETKEMHEVYPKEVEKIRKQKKIAFNQNNGTMKIATTHSFKGYECETIFLIVEPEDSDEMVYTALTRSKHNILVFTPKYSKFEEFFNLELSTRDLTEVFTDSLQGINTAIESKNKISFSYKQYNNQVLYENIMPYKILFMNDNYYLTAKTEEIYKYSIFRVSNISNVLISNSTFAIDVDLLDFINNIQTPFAKYSSNFRENLIKVIIQVDKNKVRFFENKKFMPSQENIGFNDDGNYQISFMVTDEMEVEPLIKQWLPYLKVIEPISLDEKIKNDIRKYLRDG
ncbi:MAG: WYL domain-containing protein [Arcobacteraceae bacterium]|jgi:hypothetical protein|nr:WYL domain-containing protein [Arcobacteraceae bacterium]